MSTAYPEPPPACLDLQLRRVQKAVAILSGAQGHDLEVSHLPGAGWCLELRFDRSVEGERRQPFTGMQEEIGADELEAEESKEVIVLRAGDRAIRFARDSELSPCSRATARCSAAVMRRSRRTPSPWRSTIT